jgi:hypothetical protein
MYPECHHIMPNAAKCHSPALRGKAYCYYHLRLHSLAPKPAPASRKLKIPSLADRREIQTAISQVSNALTSSRINLRDAGLLLYALQIASHNIAHMQMNKEVPVPGPGVTLAE